MRLGKAATVPTGVAGKIHEQKLGYPDSERVSLGKEAGLDKKFLGSNRCRHARRAGGDGIHMFTLWLGWLDLTYVRDSSAAFTPCLCRRPVGLAGHTQTPKDRRQTKACAVRISKSDTSLPTPRELYPSVRVAFTCALPNTP